MEWAEPDRHRIVKSIREVAEALSASQRTLARWNTSGDLPRRKDGRYSTKQICKWLLEREEIADREKGHTSRELAEARDKKALIEGKIRELELLRLRRELVTTESVTMAFDRLCGSVRAGLAGFAEQVAPQCEGLNAHGIQAVIERELDALCCEMDANAKEQIAIEVLGSDSAKD
jgi:hypothetical protein